jgi:hypothetical protein
MTQGFPGVLFLVDFVVENVAKGGGRRKKWGGGWPDRPHLRPVPAQYPPEAGSQGVFLHKTWTPKSAPSEVKWGECMSCMIHA